MTLVDSHVHAWGPDREEYPWQETILPPGWEGAYTYESLVADMDRANVDEAVVVTTPLYGRGPDANNYTLAAIDAHPNRLWGVGLIELFPDDPSDAGANVQRLASEDRILGVRMHAALEYAESPSDLNPSANWILNNRLNPVFDTAAEMDIAVFLFPKAQQLGMVKELAKRHLDTQFIVDHMVWPDETTAPDAAPWADFEAVATCDNVAVKVSSVPRSAEEPWPYADIHSYVINLVEWFGAERLMLGSDYPWMNNWATYEECLSWLDEVDQLSKRDRRYLRYQAFREIHE